MAGNPGCARRGRRHRLRAAARPHADRRIRPYLRAAGGRINTAFARWDLSHLHVFELADGRRIGFPDEDFDETNMLDHRTLKPINEPQLGEEFEFIFDFGDHWLHRCTVGTEKVDPLRTYGAYPERPVPIWGWGWIPDQRERVSEEGEEPLRGLG